MKFKTKTRFKNVVLVSILKLQDAHFGVYFYWARRRSVKKVLWKMWEKSQERITHESRFNKVVVYSSESLLKRTHCEVFQKRLCRNPVNRCICLLSFSLILLSLVCFSMFLEIVTKYCFCYWVILTLSWWRPSSYRNQPIDLQSKSMD